MPGVKPKATGAENVDLTIKLLVLGDSAVGKSSLLMRYCESKFDSNFVITIGVDFKNKVIQRWGRKVRLQVWDTAGQERFRTITPSYYRTAQGVILAYDITYEKSFDNVKYWLKNLAEYNNDAAKILVANKVDRANERAVKTEQGQKLAEEYNMVFFETSAKSNVNVDAAFEKIADLVAETQGLVGPGGVPQGGPPGGVSLGEPHRSQSGGCACAKKS